MKFPEVVLEIPVSGENLTLEDNIFYLKEVIEALEYFQAYGDGEVIDKDKANAALFVIAPYLSDQDVGAVKRWIEEVTNV